MRVPLLAGVLVAAGLLWPGAGSASEQPSAGGVMRVSARVLAVEPVVEGDAATSAACAAQPPPAGGGLVDRLAWDLRAHCPRQQTVTGYRVTYQWDGRTYQRVMAHPPAGDTLGLRVSVR